MKSFHIFNQLDKDNTLILGLTDELTSIYIHDMHILSNKPILVILPTLYEANKLCSLLKEHSDNVLLFPMDDFLTSEAIAISPELKTERLITLKKLSLNGNYIIVTHLTGYLRYLPDMELYKKKSIQLSCGDSINYQNLIINLTDIGYTNSTLVSKTGDMGIRGYIIDLYPIDERYPVRIELFDNEIESIRYFDPDTQRSLDQISSINIYPFTEFLTEETQPTELQFQKYLPLGTKTVSLNDYTKDNITIFINYEQLKSSYYHLNEDIFAYQRTTLEVCPTNYIHALESINPNYVIYISSLDNISTNYKYCTHYNSSPIKPYKGNLEALEKDMINYLENDKTVVMTLNNKEKDILKYLTVSYTITTEDNIYQNKINIIFKEMTSGFTINNMVYITLNDIYSASEKNSHYSSSFKMGTKIKDISNLLLGDYVVHRAHGIGRYEGITSLSKNGFMKDYLKIAYSGNDKLYIPVEKIDLISKFSHADGIACKLSKLGGTEWEKTKLRVRKKIEDMAQKLIETSANRTLMQGYSFNGDSELEKKFDQLFPYTETVDQMKAISDVKADMESNEPMDRLLCGDVGYGKTEVAFRAMFRAVINNKQVVYLCPTTILSNQHYDNALIRFREFPINIALLNRFTSPQKVKQILIGLKEQTIDIVIGTHRVLSDDVQIKNLGLLIVDEEQRFGVIHKERIKQYKNNVDVLTLSATPIPRTLQMSMAGLRKLSLIETAPVDRYPIQTYVLPFNKSVIKDAIYNELSRHGQIFILYNKIDSIAKIVSDVAQLVKEARITYCHGRMSKIELENKMISFINHEYDVLICTTIIETGIDIPNVNTLIVIDADKFGLSQLYQIRGRVGRSNKLAYCYLMYQPNKTLNEIAVKRLNAIKDFTALGSGYKIAMRDLSIRGAGDLLGSEQAGFIDSVGIDLYLDMLNEEIAKLKGNFIINNPQDDKPMVDVTTHIDSNYVDDETIKIEIHRMINEIDSYEKLLQVKEELEDRFGKVDNNMIIYMYQEWFESLALQYEINDIKQTDNTVELILPSKLIQKLDMEKLFYLVYDTSRKFKMISRGNQIRLTLNFSQLDRHWLYYLTEILSKLDQVKKE